jgi:hypothetical protein
VNIVLDENFPLGMVRVLQQDGHQVEHIITLGWRGASDSRIRDLLRDSGLLFLTQDDDFFSSGSVAAIVIVSRVRQARPLRERIALWRAAIRDLSAAAPAGRLFELTDAGVLRPWRTGQSDESL